MLNRLLESKPQFARNGIGTAASTAIHIVIITVAAYMTTAAAALQSSSREKIIPLHFHSSARLTREVRNPPARLQSTSAGSVSAPRFTSPTISARIPAIDIPLGSSQMDDFTEGLRGPGTGDIPATGLTSAPDSAYNAMEVEVPASPLAGSEVPVYPPSLRAAGIEGRVVTEFVVDARGRAPSESIRIISSTNDLFSASVKHALERTRFSPAKIGGKSVPQLVQQLFVFRLDR